MKRLMEFLLAGVGALGLSACSAGETTEQSSVNGARVQFLKAMLEDEAAGYVMVAAHRACWIGGAPENSLAAISECIRLGVDIIELDVALTKDGAPVLMHDVTLGRTTNATGAVGDYTLAELQGVRLRAGAGGSEAELTDESIPTLESALQLASGRVLINVDAKGDVFAAAFRVIEKAGVADHVVMKMNVLADDEELRSAPFLGKTYFMPIVRQCAPEIVGRTCIASLSEAAAAFAKYDPVAFEVLFSDEAWLAAGRGEIVQRGARVWVNALAPYPEISAGLTDAASPDDAPPDAWARILELGGDIIQTDHPGELIRFLQELGTRR